MLERLQGLLGLHAKNLLLAVSLACRERMHRLVYGKLLQLMRIQLRDLQESRRFQRMPHAFDVRGKSLLYMMPSGMSPSYFPEGLSITSLDYLQVLWV